MRQIVLGVLAGMLLIGGAGAAPTAKHKSVLSTKPQTVHTYQTLLLAVKAGDLEAVRFMLKSGVSPNEADATHKTALMYAADTGRYEIAQMLLARGADALATDDSNLSALDCAYGNAKMCILLKHYKATTVDQRFEQKYGKSLPPYKPVTIPDVSYHPNVTAHTPTLSIFGDNMSTDSNGFSVVEGYVSNDADYPAPYIEVGVNFYDAYGVQVDSGIANTQNLSAGGTWSFKVTSLREGIAKYKIVKIKRGLF